MNVTIRVRRRFLCLIGVLTVTAALVPFTSARAEVPGELGALAAYPQRYVRPISVTEQLEHCRALVAAKEDRATLAKCFRYAALLLDDGVRLRRTFPPRSEAFEERLDLGARDITARLEALSLDDEKRLDHDLRELDEAIRSVRVDLSRIAAAERMQLSLVSRGGVSLGNWQAGFLYSVTEWAKTRRGHGADPTASDAAFSTVTGASAGAVNGFAATIEGCKRPNFSASDSLYYQVWTELGLFGRHGRPGLFPGKKGGSTALALFTDEALQSTLSKAASYVEKGGQLPSCSVDFGFVATHIDPTKSPVHVRQDGDPILTTKKLKEKFSVRLDFVGAPSGGSEPAKTALRITNIGPPGAMAGDQVYYAGLGHTQEVPLQSLMLGVRASGAFPGAFPPVPLAYTEYLPGPDGTVLRKKRLATFIDGGILDNTPVGLAVSLDEWRGEPTHPHPLLEGLIPVEPRTYIFLEPLVRSWVRGGEEQEELRQREKDLLKTYLAFAGDLLATTTDAQLTNTAEQFPFVRRESQDWTRPRLSVPERHMPITGAQFEHFMAFLEQDFRIFDFYVGMADAYEYLEREACLAAPEPESCETPENLRRLDAALKDANPNYRCIRAYYESEDSKVLTRMTTAQLPRECEELKPVTCDGAIKPDSKESVAAFLASRAVLSEGGEDRCVDPAIANHNFRALLAGMHNYKVWMQSDEYSEADELDHFFGELSAGEPTERFIYIDLPTHLRRKEGYLDKREVRQAFRSLIQTSIDKLGAEQEGMSSYAFLLGGRPAADIAFGKDYPKRILGVGAAQNGVELAYGRRLGRTPWRWDSTFRFFNLQQQDFAPDLDPFTGEFYLSTQITRILSPSEMVDFELGAGWAAVESLAFSSSSPGHMAFRSGPRSYLAAVILQRVYVAFNVDYYPIKDVDDSYRKSVVDNWEFNLTAGWRFLF